MGVGRYTQKITQVTKKKERKEKKKKRKGGLKQISSDSK
jgi:hypothetical protein